MEANKSCWINERMSAITSGIRGCGAMASAILAVSVHKINWGSWVASLAPLPVVAATFPRDGVSTAYCSIPEALLE